ncbi:MAG: hypothetical protein GWN29_11650 [Gammaproteobacteria bacterium]|nr:hypothetical protein [Gammaproteobacteria bacterium]
MANKFNILFLGASYGSLFAAKAALAGHSAHLICLPEEAELINSEGAIVRLPVRGLDAPVELNTKTMPGTVTAGAPEDANPADYDLVVLAMQEPQYRVAVVKDLLNRVGASGKPCMSIMNMPPLSYLKRIPTIDAESIKDCYADASAWDNIDPSRITLCSPDPQAFRPPEEKCNVLQVGLPTNFKAARFESDEDTAILRQLEEDIQNVRYEVDGQEVELPVKLRVHDSVFVPLAKWSMLCAGNYRCVQAEEMRPIREAVHSDLAASEAVYNWVVDLTESLGGDRADLVPFEKYANAALSLQKPSSAARALAAGAPYIERVDKLVQSLAAAQGKQSDTIDETVSLVDSWLTKNRAQAA